MTDFVLDCSVAMGWCFEDEANAATESALELLREGSAFVPPIWFLEIVNVLGMAERRRRIKKSDSIRFCALLRSLPIFADSGSEAWEYAERVLSLSREHHLSAYDTAYLDLALRRGLALATRDQKLQTACRQAEVRLLLET